jgi:hypothetical protein
MRPIPEFEQWVKGIRTEADLLAALRDAYARGYDDGNEEGWINDWERASLEDFQDD